MKNIAVTTDMITAAQDVLEAYGLSADGVNSTAVRLALVAALTAAPEHEPEQAGTLSRADAMVQAQDLVDVLATAPMKANGYPVDGWRAPTLDERVGAILRLAAFLSGGEQA